MRSEQVKHREGSVVGFIKFIAQNIYSCDELDNHPSSYVARVDTSKTSPQCCTATVPSPAILGLPRLFDLLASLSLSLFLVSLSLYVYCMCMCVCLSLPRKDHPPGQSPCRLGSLHGFEIQFLGPLATRRSCRNSWSIHSQYIGTSRHRHGN